MAFILVALPVGVLAQLAPVLVVTPVAHAATLAPDAISANGTTQAAVAVTAAPTPVPVPSVLTPSTPPSLGAGQPVPANALPMPPLDTLLRPRPQMPMQPGTLALTAGRALHFTGSDGRFIVDVPVGAVTTADLAAAGGALSLRITQVDTPSGSNAGGSDIFSFGTYVVQLVDAAESPAAVALHAPLTFSLQLDSKFGGLDLTNALVVLNGPLPVGVSSVTAANAGVTPPGSTTTTVPAAPIPAGTFGLVSTKRATYDATHRRLMTTVSLGAVPPPSPPAFAPSGTVRAGSAAGLVGPNAGSTGGGGSSTSVSWNTNAAIASFGRPDPSSVDLSGGGYNLDLPVTVPAGPGGLTPPIHLTYSSASVAENHGIQAAANWVGEGWNLGLGAITWSEKNSTDVCNAPTGQTCAGNGWYNVWQLSDPFGTSAQLIPPDINYSTYWDDSPWFPCDVGTTTQAPTHACPVLWHTAPETYAKVEMFKSPIIPPYAGNAYAPCFRVWLKSGIMEEFGCTSDSLAYYVGLNTADYVYSWNLDLITDLSGNQVHLVYKQDPVSKVVPGTNTTTTYIRDTVLDHIEWDSPGCHNANTACTGASWAPQMRVRFSSTPRPSGAAAARMSIDPSRACNPDATQRCDDPVNISGGLNAPDVNSTAVLTDVYVDVRGSSTATWSMLRDYQFSYRQWGPSSSADPLSGFTQSLPGLLALTDVQEVASDGVTKLPDWHFSYSQHNEFYLNPGYGPSTAAGCGGSVGLGFNEPANGGSCLLWAKTPDDSSYYLTDMSNGLGLHEQLTWQNARSNTHGVPTGQNAADPLYCTSNPNGYPCNQADDYNWSRIVLTKRLDIVKQVTQAGTASVISATNYSYALTANLPAPECGGCTQGYTWGNFNDNDYRDFYNQTFMGFASATVTNPDGSREAHSFYSTEGWGFYDMTQVKCITTTQCNPAPWWDVANAAHGREKLVDYFDTNGTTLLKEVATAYQAVCPSGTPAWTGWGNWDNHIVATLDHNNPVAVCDVQPTSTVTRLYDGGSSAASLTTTYDSYDSFGRLTQSTDQATGGSPWQIRHRTAYVWYDAVSATATGATGEYVIDRPAFGDIEDVNGVRYACSSVRYSGVALSFGNVNIGRALPTTETTYTSGCGAGTATNPIATTAPTGALSTTLTYDLSGQVTGTQDPEAAAGNTAHVGCTPPTNTGTWSACTTYDAIFDTLAVSSSNALNQTAGIGYGATTDAHGGFGLWPTSTTDRNGQITRLAYDVLGRVTSVTQPSETTGLTTNNWAYSITCAAYEQAPCIEIDQTQRLDSGTIITTRSFYDGFGRLVETRKPGPAGNDIVQFSQYDVSGRENWQSIPYFVPAYNGTGSAFATPDTTQPHTAMTYDGLGRVKTVTDPLGRMATTSYGVQSGTFGGHGINTDEVTTTVDALGHKMEVWTDPFGRTNIVRRFTGNSTSTYALYATMQDWYSYQGPLANVVHPDGTTLTSFSYDLAGRKVGMTDPDSGSWSYSYDANGNLLQQSDGRGAAGTIYAGYDGVNRQLWRNTTNSATGAYVTYSYDSTLNGNLGIGRLTGESFNGGAGGTALGAGSYAYTYDARGQRSAQTVTLGGTAYAFAYAYNDAGQPTSTTYSDGEVEALSYDATGRLAGATTTLSGGTASTLANALTYTGAGGAYGRPTSATVGNGVYSFAASFDTLGRLSSNTLSRVSPAATLFSSVRGYDAVGNVTSVSTTLPAGTDNQAFCYDEQNRLTWASAATGTPPCGGTLTAGTLAGASYTQSFAYDTFGRLTSGPLGSYTYGPGLQAPAPAIPSPLHAALSAGAGYTATYDATGEMSCRAPTAAVGTCNNTLHTGQQLGYDNEGRLVNWSSSAGASDAYDGEGQRVAQQTVNGTTTTTTFYVANLMEITTTTTGSGCTTVCGGTPGGIGPDVICGACGGGGTTTTTTTKYLPVPGVVTAVRVGGTLSYLASDGLGSVSAALDEAGNVTAAQLFSPYGMVRYANGTMPTARGYTGQRQDTATGLDYYNARYYDPALGQFTSADSLADGLNRYGYVHGNPTTATDPTGHFTSCVDGVCGSNGGTGGYTRDGGSGGGTGSGGVSSGSGGSSSGGGDGGSDVVCRNTGGCFTSPSSQFPNGTHCDANDLRCQWALKVRADAQAAKAELGGQNPFSGLDQDTADAIKKALIDALEQGSDAQDIWGLLQRKFRGNLISLLVKYGLQAVRYFITSTILDWQADHPVEWFENLEHIQNPLNAAQDLSIGIEGIYFLYVVRTGGAAELIGNVLGGGDDDHIDQILAKWKYQEYTDLVPYTGVAGPCPLPRVCE